MILFNRAFNSEQDLLDAINKSQGRRLSDQQVAVGDFDMKRPLVAVTNYILSPEDLERLKIWLKHQKMLSGGNYRHSLKNSRVMLVISYACCTKTMISLLSPKYGTMKLKVG